MVSISAPQTSSRRLKRLAIGSLVILLVASGWALNRWRQYERLEPLRNGISEMKEGNYERARTLIEPFARQGNPHASRLMGQLYAFGLGVPLDSMRARMWFRISECECAEPGQHELNTAFDMARGFAGRKDAKVASQWLQHAAEAGNQAAQHLIADHARVGTEGFEVSEEVSRFWREFPTLTGDAHTTR